MKDIVSFKYNQFFNRIRKENMISSLFFKCIKLVNMDFPFQLCNRGTMGFTYGDSVGNQTKACGVIGSASTTRLSYNSMNYLI